MKWFFAIGAVVSLICAIFNNKMNDLTSSILSSGPKAVELILILAGGICFWSGIMKVAEDSKLSSKIARLFSPIIKLIFRNPSKASIESISMNVSANILGLGNAATPLGIQAMKNLKEQNLNKDVASHNMILFCILNTSSVQIIPTTVLTLRIAHGSSDPFSIFLPTIVSSFGCLIVCVTFAKIFAHCLGDKL